MLNYRQQRQQIRSAENQPIRIEIPVNERVDPRRATAQVLRFGKRRTVKNAYLFDCKVWLFQGTDIEAELLGTEDYWVLVQGGVRKGTATVP
jgi:hypothetical protein